MSFLRKPFPLVLAAILSACGGGGGNTSSTSGTGNTGGQTIPPAVSNDKCLTLNPTPLNLTLKQGEGGRATVTATANCDFPDIVNVAIVDNKGVLSGSTISVLSKYTYRATLSIQPALPAGIHEGIIEVRLCKDDPLSCRQPHAGSPWKLPYKIDVMMPISWSVGSGSTTLLANSSTALSSLATQIKAEVKNAPAATWSASSSASWLKVDSASAAGGAALSVTVDPTEFAKLANFAEHKATVTLASAATTDRPAVAFTLKKNLAELHYAGARLQGSASTILLRGRGFDGVTDLSGALSSNGPALSNITRISDRELSASMPATSAGTTTFTIANAAGLKTPVAELRTLAPPAAYGYKLLPNTGVKATVSFDTERQALLVVNRTARKLQRYAYSAGAWNESSVVLPKLTDAGFSPDGKSIVALTGNKLLVLDPVTLEERSSYDIPDIQAFDGNSLQELAITNDGRAYFATGDGWRRLVYFDLVQKTLVADMSSHYDGPWFSLSDNGERLVMASSASISPSPPMLLLNAADGIFKKGPSNPTFFYDASQSRDGGRIMLDSMRVYDKDLMQLGSISIDDGSYRRGWGDAGVVSPDGKKAYVMYYHDGKTYDFKPRIYVYDIAPGVAQANYKPIGYFDVADAPTNCKPMTSGCDPRARSTITPDGATLFFAGNSGIVVLPVPQQYR